MFFLKTKTRNGLGSKEYILKTNIKEIQSYSKNQVAQLIRKLDSRTFKNLCSISL